MAYNIRNLFSELNQEEFAEGLFEKVWTEIKKQKRIRTARRRLIVFLFVLTALIAAAVPMFSYVRTAFAESGFGRFFSLLFSDTDIIAVYWKSLALSLLETLPVTGLIVFLAFLCAILESLRRIARDAKNIFFPINNA